MSSHRVARRSLCALLAAATVVAACSGDDAAPASSAATTSAPPPTTRPDDGVFRVGAVIPNGGAVPDLGVSMRAALETARLDINELKVRGQRIDVDVVDEGESPTATRAAVQSLVDDGVDALIGPTSSINVLATLPTAVKAGVLTCSPTASTMSLDDFPRNGLFFRTVPSDSLQAVGIAQQVIETGRTSVVIAYVDDAYGRPFADAVFEELRRTGNDPTRVAFPSGRTPSAELLDEVAAAEPDVVVVLADATFGPSIIGAVDTRLAEDARPRADGLGVQYVVNDAMRRLDQNTALSNDLVSRVIGVAPRAYPANNDFTTLLLQQDTNAAGLYAINAYDCLTLIALGAQLSDSFQGRTIHDQLVAMTTSGRSCSSYSDCITAAEATPNIDYDGPSRSLAIDAKGDVSSTTFIVFRTDPDTREELTSLMQIGQS